MAILRLDGFEYDVDDRVVDAVAARFRALPLKPGGHELLLEQAVAFAVWALVLTDSARTGRARGQVAAKECRRLAAAIREVGAAIEGLSRDAFVAISERQSNPMASSLPILIDIFFPQLVDHAEDAARMFDAQGKQGGRYDNPTAEGIARVAAGAFEELTGQRPKIAVGTDTTRHASAGEAYGSFLELVSGLFNVFSVNANAEHYARQAVNRRMEEIER